VPSPSRLPLLWLGTPRDESGHAEDARASLGALRAAGRELAGGSSPPPVVSVHACAPAGGQPLRAGGPNVARTAFPTDRLPAQLLPRLLELDEVWVPSSLNVDSFRVGGVPGERLHVLPEALDPRFSPQAAPLELPGLRSLTFLARVDAADGAAVAVLLDAWERAFAPDDDVTLLLAYPRAGAPDAARHPCSRTAPVVAVPLPAGDDLPRLYAAVGAFVAPGAGGGWSRPWLDAVAAGLPTIACRHGTSAELLHDSSAWLVDGAVTDAPASAPPLLRGHRFFLPDADDLARALREVAAGGPDVAARAATACAELGECLAPRRISDRIAELTDAALERWRERSSRPVACVWRGEFGGAHSLGVVNDGCVRALEAGGAVVPLLAPGAARSDSDAVGVAQHWPPSFDAPTAGPFVLYQPWEFGRVPAAWVEAIRRTVDEVWTPSRACRDAYVASGVAPELVRVVPNAVDLDAFSPDGEPLPLPTRRRTVLLFVGAPLFRKGFDALLAAYGRAFSAADDVALVLRVFGLSTVYRGNDASAAIAAFRSRADAPELVVLEQDLPREAVPALYRAASAVVQPYRGEGFCLPALEALACGRPVVVTAGGPTDDFVTPECGWLVDSTRRPLAPGAIPEQYALAGDGFMLEPDVDSLVAALEEAADPAARAPRAAAARRQAERHSWATAGAIVEERLAELRGRTPIRRIAPAVVPDRRRLLLAALPDWSRRDTWARPLQAYAEAFPADADTTLVLHAEDHELALDRLRGELRTLGDVPDIALAAPGTVAPEALELAADAVIVAGGVAPRRARRLVAPDPAALRALLEAA